MKKKSSNKYDNSELEATFLAAWKSNTGLSITSQHKFHPRRMWRFDFAFPEILLAIEIQGYGHGHASYMGLKTDYEKHNSAVQLGWCILYLMKHDLDKKAILTTLAFVKEIKEQLSNSELLQIRRKLNLNTRAEISHSPSKSYSSFQDWIKSKKAGQ